MEKINSINKIIISINKICDKYCEEENKEFNKSEFEEFLRFLEIDFYDWIRENLRQFNLQK